jgi:hypothetical protein
MSGVASFIEVELVEQLALVALQLPHHRKHPAAQCGARTESLFAAGINGLLQQNLPEPDMALDRTNPDCAHFTVT